MSYQEMLFTFLGGLGIFLFGIKYLGDGFKTCRKPTKRNSKSLHFNPFSRCIGRNHCDGLDPKQLRYHCLSRWTG